MGMKYIDAGMLKQAFLAGAKGLEANKEWINELNVFPVPDGDTGTNMTMTILAAAREVAAIEKPTMENLAKAISFHIDAGKGNEPRDGDSLQGGHEAKRGNHPDRGQRHGGQGRGACAGYRGYPGVCPGGDPVRQ